MNKWPIPADFAAGETVYGKCQVDLGGVGTAAAKARNALVRLLARPMAGGVPGPGRAGDTQRILVDRRGHEAETAQRQASERSFPFALSRGRCSSSLVARMSAAKSGLGCPECRCAPGY